MKKDRIISLQCPKFGKNRSLFAYKNTSHFDHLSETVLKMRSGKRLIHSHGFRQRSCKEESCFEEQEFV